MRINEEGTIINNKTRRKEGDKQEITYERTERRKMEI